MDKKPMTTIEYKNKEFRPKASLSDFIWSKKDSLDESFCSHVIHRFDTTDGTYDGLVGSDRRLDPGVKITRDFSLTGRKDWLEEDKTFFKALKKGLKEYTNYLNTIHHNCMPPQHYKMRDNGYKLQRYEPDGFYDWHNDWMMDKSGSRVIVFMWYLNTIREEDCGYTEFGDGTRIQPECGKLLLFPATWSYLHRGYPPKVRKYLCNGWVFSKP